MHVQRELKENRETWSFLMAEPSLLKCKSLAMAEILHGEGVLLSKRLRLAAKEGVDAIDDEDESFRNLVSTRRALVGGAKEPAAKVDAITGMRRGLLRVYRERGFGFG